MTAVGGPLLTPPAKVRPSALWYLLVLPILLAGGVFAVTTGIDEFKRMERSFERFGADGRGTVSAKAGQRQTVWAVWSDGRSTESLVRPRATVVVTGPDGSEVPFDRSAANSRFTIAFGGASAIDLGRFTARERGDYEIEVRYEGGTEGGVLEAGVGDFGVVRALKRVATPILASLTGAIGWTVLLSILRVRSRRRARADGPFTGPFGG